MLPCLSLRDWYESGKSTSPDRFIIEASSNIRSGGVRRSRKLRDWREGVMRLNRVLAATLAALFVGGCSTRPEPDKLSAPKAGATVGAGETGSAEP